MIDGIEVMRRFYARTDPAQIAAHFICKPHEWRVNLTETPGLTRWRKEDEVHRNRKR